MTTIPRGPAVGEQDLRGNRVILRFGNCELDTDRYALRCNGRAVEVQPRVLDLLIHLASAGDRVVSRAELDRAVWKGVNVSETALRKAIKEARRAVDDDGRHQQVIQTVRGRGFRLMVPVSEAPSARPGPVDPFIGRRETLAALESELEAARSGTGRLVLLEGEPGIGKSRTLSELTTKARLRGFRVLIGRGVEGVDAPSYWPWAQVLRQVLEDGDRPELPPELAAVLAPMMPELRELLPDAAGQKTFEPGDARDSRFRLFDVLARTWAGLARHQPLLLAFDDLHRADAGTLLLLDFLLREVERVPVLMLGTLRSASHIGDPERARQLGDLQRAPRVRSLRMLGLEREEVGALVTSLLGEVPADPQLDELMQRTAGNPFFVRAVATIPKTQRGVDGELPQTVQQAVLRHLDALPPARRALLARASVLGRQFEFDLLASLDGAAPEVVLAELDAAAAARVVEPFDAGSSTYQFSHALICEALYASHPAGQLRSLHAQAAGALEAREPPPRDGALRIAHHLARAVPTVDCGVAITACRRAAVQARQRLAYEEGVALLEQAVDLLSAGSFEETVQLELLLELADAQVEAGLDATRESSIRAAELARRIGDAESLARAALSFAGGQEDARMDPEIVDLLGEAMKALGPDDSPLSARVRSRRAQAIYFGPELERAAPLSTDAVAMARRCDDLVTLGHTLKARHWTAWAGDNLDGREEIAVELLELAAATGSSELEHEALAISIQVALERGDRALVEARFEDYTRLARRGRRLFFDWNLEHYRVVRHLLDGEIDLAEATVERAFRLGQQTRYAVAATWYGMQLYEIRRAQGRMMELHSVTRQMARDYPSTPWRLVLAIEDARAGRREESLAVLQDLLSNNASKVRRDFAFLSSLQQMADLCALLDAAEEARHVESMLEPFADRHIAVGTGMLYLGPVVGAMGKLAQAQGREADAERHFAEARRRDMRTPRDGPS